MNLFTLSTLNTHLCGRYSLINKIKKLKLFKSCFIACWSWFAFEFPLPTKTFNNLIIVLRFRQNQNIVISVGKLAEIMPIIAFKVFPRYSIKFSRYERSCCISVGCHLLWFLHATEIGIRLFGQFSTTKTSLASKYWLVLRMTVVILARIKLTGFPFQVLPLLIFVVEVIFFFF